MAFIVGVFEGDFDAMKWRYWRDGRESCCRLPGVR